MTSVPYDQREGVIWMNGEMVNWPDAKLHVLSHALHYASSVFEGIRAYGGQIFELTQHNERLHESAAALGFEIPYSVAEIDQACRDVTAQNGLVDAYIRPVAWRRAVTVACHSASGSCSAQPGRGCSIGVGALPDAMTRPSVDTTRARIWVVPKSTPTSSGSLSPVISIPSPACRLGDPGAASPMSDSGYASPSVWRVPDAESHSEIALPARKTFK